MDAVTARSILLRLVLVIAVVAGLLAMHTLITTTSHTAVTAAVTAGHHPVEAEPAPGESAVPSDCGSSDCLPLHAMGVMTCLLALLVAWALAGAAPPVGRGMSELSAAVRALVATPRTAGPAPPSLIALSISRT